MHHIENITHPFHNSKVKDYSELSPKTTQPILDEPYTINEVTEQIQTLKYRKAPGPDYITNEICRMSHHLMECISH
jgi:hypothetical protein